MSSGAAVKERGFSPSVDQLLLARWKAKVEFRVSTILVVDDDPDVRFMVRWILEDAGHEVIEAAHGTAALNLISPRCLPDLVVTDLMMPVLDGRALIEHLRSAPATATIPIVVVTGNAPEARTLQASGLVEAVVRKPFDAAELAQCIQAAANQTRTRLLSA